MPLEIMQNLYPASSLYLTGHCYVRSMFVKHNFVSRVVCLFVVAVYYYYYYYYYYCHYLSILLLLSFFNWYKLDWKFFAELCKFFQFQIKC